MSVEVLLFWVFAGATVVSSLAVVFGRSPIHSAMALVASFFFLAGIYVLLWAHTIAVLQVLVYAGAVMVLFLFVIMLLSLGESGGPITRLSLSRILGVLSTGALFATLWSAFTRLPPQPDWTADVAKVSSFGKLEPLGQLLYTSYLFPFEAVSLLLLVAMVGAVVVAKSRI